MSLWHGWSACVDFIGAASQLGSSSTLGDAQSISMTALAFRFGKFSMFCAASVSISARC